MAFPMRDWDIILMLIWMMEQEQFRKILYFNGKMTTDLYFSYKINKNISVIIGADNIFNVHPDISATAGAKNASWGDSESGGPFDAVQMGYNGMRLFTNVVFIFNNFLLEFKDHPVSSRMVF